MKSGNMSRENNYKIIKKFIFVLLA